MSEEKPISSLYTNGKNQEINTNKKKGDYQIREAVAAIKTVDQIVSLLRKLNAHLFVSLYFYR
jgi:hypothetical protein